VAVTLDRHQLVYRWDLDKTYLRTEFDTMRQLWRALVESASEKQTIPGASALLRELRATGPAGIYILSGSPEQMRRALEAKLRLDGIRWDGLVLKPSLRNLLRGRFRFLRDQVGFKLGAMLASRESVPATVDEMLFGDDAETDAFNYSLYADLCAGRVGVEVLRDVLEAAQVNSEDAREIERCASRLDQRDHCARIFIHMDRMSPVDAFAAYGNRVCPFHNYFQPAAVLLEMGAIDAPAALRVAAELVIDQAFSPEALTASYLELARRGYLSRRPAAQMAEALSAVSSSEFASATSVLSAFASELVETHLPDEALPVEVPELDYVAQLVVEQKRAHVAKNRVLTRF